MKKIIAFLLFCSAFQAYTYDLDPVLSTEAGEMLTPGQKSTLKAALKINSLYYQEIKPDNPEIMPSDKDKARGFILFGRDYMAPIYYNSNPIKTETAFTSIDITAAINEPEPALTGLVALENGDLTVSVSDLTSESGAKIKSSAIEVKAVKHLVKTVTEGVVQLMPEMLISKQPFKMYKGVTRPVWFFLNTPEDAKPGSYSGEVSFKLSGKEAAKVKLKVEVLPFKLADDPEMNMGWFALDATNEKVIADYVKHRNNSLQLSWGGVNYEIKNGDVKMDFSGYDKVAVNIKKFNLGSRFQMVTPASGLETMYTQFSPEFNKYYKKIISLTQDWAKSKGIKVFYHLVDEVRESEPQRNMAAAEKYAKLAKEVPGVITWNDPMLDGDAKEDYTKLVDYFDILCPHCVESCKRIIESTRQKKKELWFYNSGRTRVSFGFLMWKNRAKGRLEWAYTCWDTSNSRQPGAFSACRGGIGFTGIVYPVDGEFLSTPWYEYCSEGIDDYAYIYTLEQLIKKVNGGNDENAKKLAKNSELVLDGIRGKVPAFSAFTDEITGTEKNDILTRDWRKAVIAEILKLYKY